MRLLLPTLLLLPFIEITLLIKVGQWLGFFYTLVLILLTAMIGMNLLRQQGISTLLKANEKMQQGSLPAAEMLEGILIAIGGVLFIIPGFFTDLLGFVCMIPYTRRLLVKQLIKNEMLATEKSPTMAFTSNFSGSFATPKNDDIIEGQFSRDDHSRLN